MPQTNIVSPEEAVENLVIIETLIKAARGIYVQAMENRLAIDSDTREEVMIEIEHYGLSLAKAKQEILTCMDLHAYPFVVTRM